MPSYFFPLLFITPDAEAAEECQREPFKLVPRRWSVSTFDLATLAMRHRLHLPYQLMDVLLGRCDLEVEIAAANLDAAVDNLTTLLLGLYLGGVSPTIAPFVASHSVNDYAGINSRDSDMLREKLPTERQGGFKTADGIVEAWPLDMSLKCRINAAALKVSGSQFQHAATKAAKWVELEAAQPLLRVLREAARSIPMIASDDQALLHIWCALEALFSNVNAEVSFRIALNLSQLSALPEERAVYFDRVRKAYRVRSSVAHGSERRVSRDAVLDAWGLLMDAGNAIVRRGRLPSEEELLKELLRADRPSAYPD